MKFYLTSLGCYQPCFWGFIKLSEAVSVGKEVIPDTFKTMKPRFLFFCLRVLFPVVSLETQDGAALLQQDNNAVSLFYPTPMLMKPVEAECC